MKKYETMQIAYKIADNMEWDDNPHKQKAVGEIMNAVIKASHSPRFLNNWRPSTLTAMQQKRVVKEINSNLHK